jgi:hypothetical protein
MACYSNHLPCPSPTQYTHLSAHRSLFVDYTEAGGWNLLQPPVTRYQSTQCHISEYFNNQRSCEKLKCKITRSWPCCTLYMSVTWSCSRPCPETSPLGAKWWLHRTVQSSENQRMATIVAWQMSWHVLVQPSTAIQCFDIHSCLQVWGQVWISECSLSIPLNIQI